MIRLVGALCALALLTSCEDLRDFRGEWHGAVSPDAAQRDGFAADSKAWLTIASVSAAALSATVTLPGSATPLAFVPIRGAAADDLGDLQLSGAPLRTYLGFLEPPGEERILVFVSLYGEGRVELRVIRGPRDLYGIFRLKRI